MSTPARFSDSQYKNWMKCNQSFVFTKKALHDYINNEVMKLHSDITQRIASSIPFQNRCGSCSSRDIRLRGGNPKSWFINCKNSICDKWLKEILAVHNDPLSPSINWENADISKWPVDCYEVAKIFMPKGLDRKLKMPEDLNFISILFFMKNCNWFRKDLQNTQILIDLIDIRNKVFHSGDLRIVDNDKDRCIDLMIQLLSDLNIPGDSQAQLEMLKHGLQGEERFSAVEKEKENEEQLSLQRKPDPLSLESVKETITYLKDTGYWKPKCYEVFEALEKAYMYQKYDVGAQL